MLGNQTVPSVETPPLAAKQWEKTRVQSDIFYQRPPPPRREGAYKIRIGGPSRHFNIIPLRSDQRQSQPLAKNHGGHCGSAKRAITSSARDYRSGPAGALRASCEHDDKLAACRLRKSVSNSHRVPSLHSPTVGPSQSAIDFPTTKKVSAYCSRPCPMLRNENNICARSSC